nr:MAG TPA: hypothetical protein [Caudoviricetes sp.]
MIHLHTYKIQQNRTKVNKQVRQKRKKRLTVS